MKKNGFKTGSLALLFAITVMLSFTSPEIANAASIKKKIQKAVKGESKFGNPSIFIKGDKMVGAGYVNAWTGGFDLTGQYFIFDDISIQAHYTPLQYNTGYGTADLSLMSGAAVYHYGYNDEAGFYAGIGYTIGKYTYTTPGYDYVLGFSPAREYTVDVSGLYTTGGYEMRFDKNILLNVGYNSAGAGGGGLTVGANYSF